MSTGICVVATVIFVLSPVLFLVGLITPRRIPHLGKQHTRGNIAKTWLSIFCVSLIIMVATIPESEDVNVPKENKDSTTKQQDVATNNKDTVAPENKASAEKIDEDKAKQTVESSEGKSPDQPRDLSLEELKQMASEGKKGNENLTPKQRAARSHGNCLTEGGYHIAVSKEIFERASEYFSQRDMAALTDLAEAGLVGTTKEGVEVKLHKTHIFSGLVEIRLPGQHDIFWTNVEAVHCP